MAAAFSSEPPFFRYAVTPVARKVLIADLGLDAGAGGAPADHGVGVGLGQGRGRELAGRAADGAKQRPLRIGGDPAAVEIGLQVGLKIVVARHFVTLAAFLMKAHPPALAGRIIVLDPHRHDGAHARETVGHYADERPIAQTHQSRDIDAVDQRREKTGRPGHPERPCSQRESRLTILLCGWYRPLCHCHQDRPTGSSRDQRIDLEQLHLPTNPFPLELPYTVPDRS